MRTWLQLLTDSLFVFWSFTALGSIIEVAAPGPELSNIKRGKPKVPQEFRTIFADTGLCRLLLCVVSRVSRQSQGGVSPDSEAFPWLGTTSLSVYTEFLGVILVQQGSKAIRIQGQQVIREINGSIKTLGMPMHAWWRSSSAPTSAPTQTKQKKVRFAYKNLFYSPRHTVSPPPALAPITPPPTGYGLPGPSPYALSYVPQNPTTSVPYAGLVYAHPLLDTSSIIYDLMEHPSTIMTRNNYSLSTRTFREPATTPPLPFLAITCKHLPWIIKVYASNTLYVTLEDIFVSIYRNLRTNITSVEFNLFSTQDDQRRASRAYEKRYRRFRNTRAYEEEKRGGMKRVDFFMGHTKFLRLSNSSRHSDEWQLHVT